LVSWWQRKAACYLHKYLLHLLHACNENVENKAIRNFAMFFSLLRTVHGASIITHGLEYGPDNVAILQGETVVLRCRTDGVPTSNPRWYEFVTNPSGELISDGTQILPGHPNAARYQIITTDSITFDLQIEPTVWEDGGYYHCKDSNAVPPSTVVLGSQLIIIGKKKVFPITRMP